MTYDEVTKQDWKLFRERVPDWQEAITMDDLDGFSDEVTERVQFVAERWKGCDQCRGNGEK